MKDLPQFPTPDYVVYGDVVRADRRIASWAFRLGLRDWVLEHSVSRHLYERVLAELEFLKAEKGGAR